MGINQRFTVLFYQIKKNIFRLLIQVSFLTNPLFFVLSEKLHAQTVNLTCDVKSYGKNWGNDYWSEGPNYTWSLEIDYKKNLLVRRQNFLHKGQNYELRWNYLISTYDRNKIVAFEDKLTTVKDGLSASSITLNLISGMVTSANHMNDERGYSFSLYNGKCF